MGCATMVLVIAKTCGQVSPVGSDCVTLDARDSVRMEHVFATRDGLENYVLSVSETPTGKVKGAISQACVFIR